MGVRTGLPSSVSRQEDVTQAVRRRSKTRGVKDSLTLAFPAPDTALVRVHEESGPPGSSETLP